MKVSAKSISFTMYTMGKYLFCLRIVPVEKAVSAPGCVKMELCADERSVIHGRRSCYSNRLLLGITGRLLQYLTSCSSSSVGCRHLIGAVPTTRPVPSCHNSLHLINQHKQSFCTKYLYFEWITEMQMFFFHKHGDIICVINREKVGDCITQICCYTTLWNNHKQLDSHDISNCFLLFSQ